MYPDLPARVEKNQQKQKQSHDNSKPVRTFAVGATVYVEDFTSRSKKWIAGVVQEVAEPLSYRVKLHNGSLVRRHVDNLRARTASVTPTREDAPEDNQIEDWEIFGRPFNQDIAQQPPQVDPAPPITPPRPPPLPAPPEPRRSIRARNQRTFFEPCW